MKRKYQSEILSVIHQDAEAMYAVGAISEERMREYDRDCLLTEAGPTTRRVPNRKTKLVYTAKAKKAAV
jgi:DNA-binding transcriptional regulator YiaG